jgi:hypothetical protein
MSWNNIAQTKQNLGAVLNSFDWTSSSEIVESLIRDIKRQTELLPGTRREEHSREATPQTQARPDGPSGRGAGSISKRRVDVSANLAGGDLEHCQGTPPASCHGHRSADHRSRAPGNRVRTSTERKGAGLHRLRQWHSSVSCGSALLPSRSHA